MNLVLDGVFNHVGRDFWAFRDVVEKRENSPYKDWFTVNFSLNNGFNEVCAIMPGKAVKTWSRSILPIPKSAAVFWMRSVSG